VTGTFTPRPEWLALDWHHACLEAGMLTIQRCGGCGEWRHPPRRFCARCASPEASFEPVRGTGVVRSLAVSHRSMDPGWQAEVTFATLVVELEEGPRVLAATHARPDEVPIGTEVTCTIEARSEDFALLWAEPTTA
jgi:hypothetical protein